MNLSSGLFQETYQIIETERLRRDFFAKNSLKCAYFFCSIKKDIFYLSIMKEARFSSYLFFLKI